MWPLNLLQNITRAFAESSGIPLADGHLVSANGPIAIDRPTVLVALAFANDPVLGQPFLQLVGLTADEYETARQWRVRGILDILSRDNPLLVTDLARTSVLVGADAALAANGIADEGSSLFAHAFHGEILDLEEAGARGVRIICGAAHVESLSRALTSRISRGRPFELISPKVHVIFTPESHGPARLWFDAHVVHIDVTAGLLRELQGMLRPVRGIAHSFVLKGLSFAIEPTEIRTLDGEVVETIA